MRVISELRRAARDAAFVVLRRGPEAARCEGFVEHVDGRHLRISPVAAESFADAPRVDVFGDAWRLRVSTPPRVVDAETLSLDLQEASLEDLPPRRRARMPYARPVVLVAPVGVGDFRTLAVVDFTNDTVGVDLPFAMTPGTTLHHAELFADRGRIHPPSELVVMECVPWMTFDARTRFRARMRWLGPSDDTQPTHDVLDEPERIARVVELATLLDVAVDAEGVAGRFAPPSIDASFALILDDVGELGLRRFERPVEVAFELFGVRYEARVRTLHATRERLDLALPLVLRRRARRLDRRTPIAGATLRARHPLLGEERALELVDLSRGGASFVDDGGAYWPGLPLDEGRVETTSGLRVRIGELEVRGVERDRVHAAFTEPGTRRSEELSDLLADLLNPDLSRHDGVDFEGQLDLFREVGLLMGYMEDTLTLDAEGARRAWRAIHSAKSDVCRTLERREDDRPVASISALYAWDGNWLAQHLGARKARRGCSPGTLMTAFLDHVLPRADCRNIVFFTTGHNDKMNEIQARFRALTGSSEALGRVELDVWMSADPAPDTARAAAGARAWRREERRLLTHCITRTSGPFAVGALAFDTSPTLDDARRRFRKLSLDRRRVVRIVDGDGSPRVAALHEHAPAGVCLPQLLSASWLFPLHFERAERGVRVHSDALARALDDVRAQPHEPRRLVLTPRCPPMQDAMADAGLTHLVPANLYVINRAGLRRYLHFLTHMYGEVAVGRASGRTSR